LHYILDYIEVSQQVLTNIVLNQLWSMVVEKRGTNVKM